MTPADMSHQPSSIARFFWAISGLCAVFGGQVVVSQALTPRETPSALCRRLVVAHAAVLALSVCSACDLPAVFHTKVNQAKFATLHRAGREIRENITSGVNLVRFSPLVGNYGTEVSLAMDKAKGQVEQDFVEQHSKALEAYRDSLSLWNAKLGVNGSTTLTAADGLGRRIADTYTVQGSGSGRAFTFEIDAALQRVWAHAAALLVRADEMYLGESK